MKAEDDQFHTTRWTQVLAAKGDTETSRTALADLCELYYEPVHVFIRSRVQNESARDLTHAFFAALLEKNTLRNLQRGRGKFRSYLLGAVKNFLSDQNRKIRAEKRGNNVLTKLPGDIECFAADPPPEDATFDRQWAMTILNRALSELSKSVDNPHQFAVLKPWLNGDDPAGFTQSDAADQLGISEGAVKVAIHRLRKKLRVLVKAEIAQTLESEDEAEIATELNYLIRALSR